MGYTTDFVGNLTITPTLNEHEIEYLDAFRLSRRCVREGGPYVVPANPRAEDSSEFPGDTYNIRAPGQPNLWCNWEVCWEGDCLTWDGIEKSYSMVPWLRYLIAHFLKPGAQAQGHPGFEEFTFDHQVAGTVVGCRRDTKELFVVRVADNRVTERILNPGHPDRTSGDDGHTVAPKLAVTCGNTETANRGRVTTRPPARSGPGRSQLVAGTVKS